MFHIVNQDNVELSRFEDFGKAKEEATKAKEDTGNNFRIFEYKWVWSTKTLAER